jgi:hypothetical protein
LFDDENISFDASLVIYINSTNIPPIMIINRIYKHQKLLFAVACFLPGRAKNLSAPLYVDLRENDDEEVRENYTMRNFMILTSNQTYMCK